MPSSACREPASRKIAINAKVRFMLDSAFTVGITLRVMVALSVTFDTLRLSAAQTITRSVMSTVIHFIKRCVTIAVKQITPFATMDKFA